MMGATPKKRNTPTKRRSSTTSNTTRKRKTLSTTTHNHRASALSPVISAVHSAISASHTFLLTHDTHLLPPHTLSLESSISSAALSLSKIQSLLRLPTLSLSSPSPSPPPPLSSPPSCWFERFLSSSVTDEDPRWAHIFRMSRPTFSLLSSALFNSLSAVLPSEIPPRSALGCALYKLAHDGSFSFVGRRFGFSSADACRVFYTVCKVICEELGGYVCKYGSEMGEISMGFDQILLKNCCGVLGFEKFRVEGGDLLGKDGCLIVQALVDCQGRFLDVSAGWPSTFSPVSILRQTTLFLGAEESKELLNGPEIELFDDNLVPQYVLGDSCYPCLPWLVTPFVRKGEGEELSSSEMEFNEVHRRAMGIARMAFRRVRANWQVLDKRWKEKFVEFLPFIVTTACVLNNFLMKHGERLPDVDVGSGEKVEEVPVYDGEVSESAEKIRNLLALYLSRVSQAS